MNIKAIETAYKGYRFRSRLEARWAVYFDAEGMEWEYEKEGFHPPSGPYLPDFWLPQVRMWAEVKGRDFHGDEVLKCHELAVGSGYPCLLLNGAPNGRNFWACMPHFEFDSWFDDFYVDSNYIHERRFFRSTGTGDYPDQEVCSGWVNTDSINAARSARFEHGEGR